MQRIAAETAKGFPKPFRSFRFFELVREAKEPPVETKHLLTQFGTKHLLTQLTILNQAPVNSANGPHYA